ncbi:pentatricopeptide repeat-containing protein At1g71210, mitochondrial isoform X1 [Cryptomeria japonica]|uniref:pentatricopeptide repeat-containing protein At1g71210, mitochondrial isoform X1 n=1 Tax=Cryptomeria japonica TaxID=3369 RepID=UPI0027DA8A2F|nr:pentatricopeptide repeat-containing protein At1g71210, mitochondrial isoform X1 [Cryptomeria japonica]XP_059074486.1 pentatricopeptide repeat-containing protein At1g71210, mitochondrial isoform X1 [Cryptomeria japonica]
MQVCARGPKISYQLTSRLHQMFPRLNVLNELKQNGFSANEAGVVSLVNVLRKSGKLEVARMLIEESRKVGLISMYKVHRTWIGCLLGENRVDDALHYFVKRVSEGFHPNSQCYGALLIGLLKNNRHRVVSCLLNNMKDNNIFPDSRTMNAIVCLLCKEKLINVAIDLYSERSKIGFIPDNITYNKLINALCSLGKMDEAHKVLDDGMEAGFFPRKGTLAILLGALCMAGKLDNVYKLFVAGVERQCVPDYCTCSEIISSFSKAGRVDDGYAILCMLVKLNVFVKKRTYFALIDGFCVAKKGDMVSKLLLEMRGNGHLPGRSILKSVICVLCETCHEDEVLELLRLHVSNSSSDIKLYNTFIKTICRFRRPDIAMKILEKMCENNCRPNSKTYISLLHGYLKSKYVVNAVNLFRALLAETQISSKLYNVMVSGLCTIEKEDLAVMYFDEMIKKGLYPSVGCYEKVIYALCNQGNLNKALKCFWDMKQKGHHCSTFIYNVLVGSCFKSHEVNHAWFIFDNMRNQGCPPNVSTFSILISGLSDANMLESTMGVLEEMMEECLTADIFIYNKLLRGLCKEGKMEVATDLLRRMSQKGCLPNASTYDCLIFYLDRAGRVYDAQKLREEIVEKKLHMYR